MGMRVMNNNSRSVAIFCPATGRQVNVSPRWAAMTTGRHLRTAQRWAAGYRMDKASEQLLQIRLFGVLPWGAWSAFRIHEQMIENVETGETWTPQQLRSSWVTFQQLREYKRMVGTPSTAAPLRLAQ